MAKAKKITKVSDTIYKVTEEVVDEWDLEEQRRIEDGMDIWEKIHRGDYKNKMSFPDRPEKLKDRSVLGMSREEVEEFFRQKEEYDKAMEEYEKDVEIYREENGRLDAKYHADVLKYFGLPEGDEFVSAMLYLAYERGHSGGHSEMANELNSLIPLWKIHKGIK